MGLHFARLAVDEAEGAQAVAIGADQRRAAVEAHTVLQHHLVVLEPAWAFGRVSTSCLSDGILIDVLFSVFRTSDDASVSECALPRFDGMPSLRQVHDIPPPYNDIMTAKHPGVVSI